MVKSDFEKQLKKLQQAQSRIPQRAAVVAVNFSKERFRMKNWIDKRREPWKDRKRKGRGSTMVASGRLKRSIRKIQLGRNFAIIGSNVPYAQIHNDGGIIKEKVHVKEHKRKVTVQRSRKNPRTRKGVLKGRVAIGESTVTAHVRQMNTKIPARTFLAPSALLGRRIERQIVSDIKKVLK